MTTQRNAVKRVYVSVNAAKASTEALQQYHQKFKLRSAKETAQLRNRIAEQHRNLVRAVAHRMKGQCAVEFEDLEQIGMEGLLKAIERFTPSRDNAFSSFAVPYIQGAILHYLRDHGSTVKIPRRWRELRSSAAKVERKWVATKGKQPTEQQVADELGCKVEKLQQVRGAISQQNALSLEEEWHGNEPSAPESRCSTLHSGKLEQCYRQVRSRLQEMSESDRQIITSVYMQRQGRKALAKVMRLDAATLRTRLHQALESMAA